MLRAEPAGCSLRTVAAPPRDRALLVGVVDAGFDAGAELLLLFAEDVPFAAPTLLLDILVCRFGSDPMVFGAPAMSAFDDQGVSTPQGGPSEPREGGAKGGRKLHFQQDSLMPGKPCQPRSDCHQDSSFRTPGASTGSSAS